MYLYNLEKTLFDISNRFVQWFMFYFLQIQSSNISSSGCSKEIASFLTTLFGEGHPNDVIEAEKDKYLKVGLSFGFMI